MALTTLDDFYSRESYMYGGGWKGNYIHDSLPSHPPSSGQRDRPVKKTSAVKRGFPPSAVGDGTRLSCGTPIGRIRACPERLQPLRNRA